MSVVGHAALPLTHKKQTPRQVHASSLELLSVARPLAALILRPHFSASRFACGTHQTQAPHDSVGPPCPRSVAVAASTRLWRTRHIFFTAPRRLLFAPAPPPTEGKRPSGVGCFPLQTKRGKPPMGMVCALPFPLAHAPPQHWDPFGCPKDLPVGSLWSCACAFSLVVHTSTGR